MTVPTSLTTVNPTARGIVKDSPRERVESLHRRRGQDLFGLARRMGVPHEDAADIVQETMLRLWRELIAEKDVRDEDAWAFRTAYRLAIDQSRQARRSGSVFSLLTRQSDQSLTKSTDLEDVAVVWHEVDALPRQQRAVLYLRYRADLPFEQVGQAVGVSAATARTHATRALATLRERLTREND